MIEYKNVPFVPCNDCANYESCTNDFVADLLEPYDVESIEDLISNVRNKTIDDVVEKLLEYTIETYAGGSKPIRFVTDVGIKNITEQMKRGAE